jgi:hypothetical protein
MLHRATVGLVIVLGCSWAPQSLSDASKQDLLDAIMAHQMLYERVRIHYHVMPTQLEDGNVVANGAAPAIDVVLTADGERMRREATRYGPARTSFVVATTDRERVREWRHSTNDPIGQGTLMRYDNVAEAAFGLSRFYKHKVLNFATMDVLDESQGVITIEYSANPRSRAVCQYDRRGDYLRLLSFRPYFRKDETSDEWTELTSFFYSYANKPEESGSGHAPFEVRQVTRSRESYVLLKILDVDFDPEFAEDEFVLNFPKGTWVKDRDSGSIWRTTETVVPGNVQNATGKRADENTSGVRLVCPNCALALQCASNVPSFICSGCGEVFELEWPR